MQLKPISSNINDYVQNSRYVDFENDNIKALSRTLFSDCKDKLEIIETAYIFVRDHISHSWDIQSKHITVTASQALQFKEGICYSKANLLAALLRSQDIPTGFCYQRLTISDTHENGFCIHALSAVYVAGLNKWIRLDARGNNENINAGFSLDKEILAFPVRTEYAEVDYKEIYTEPLPITMQTLENNTDCLNMYLHNLPSVI